MTENELKALMREIQQLKRAIDEIDQKRNAIYYSTPGGIQYTREKTSPGDPTKKKLRKIQQLNEKREMLLNEYADKLIELEDFINTVPDLMIRAVIRWRACGKTWDEIGRINHLSGMWARKTIKDLFVI